jgi:putative membrane protein
MIQRIAVIIAGLFTWRGMWVFPVQPEHGIRVAIGTACIWIALVSYLWRTYGSKGVFAVAALGLLWVIVEYIGIKTCIPYGCFVYSELVWPRFFGTFPYALFVIRPTLVILMSSWISVHTNRLLQVMMGSILLITLDIFLDPVAVYQWVRSYDPVWVWYGVPLTNYLGWIPMSLVSVWLLLKILPQIIWDATLKKSATVIVLTYLTFFLIYVA